MYVCLQAECLIAAGEPEKAVDALRQAGAEFARIGLGFWASEVRRMEAEALLAADARGGAGVLGEQARAAFAEAIEIAEAQDAATLMLRALTGLARIDPRASVLRRLLTCLEAVAEDDGGADLTDARLVLHRHGLLPGRIAAASGR